MDPNLPDDQFELIGPLSLVFCFCSLVFVLAQCGKDRQPRTNTVGETRVNGGAAQKTFYGNAKGTPVSRRSPSSPSARQRKAKTPSQWSNVHPSPKSLACEPVVSHRNSPTTGGHSHRSGLHKPRKGKSHDPNNMSASGKKRNQKRSPDMKPVMPQTDPTQKESKKSVKEQQSTLLISATAGTVRTSATQRESQRTQMVTAMAQPEGASVAGVPKSKAVDPVKSEPEEHADIPETTHAPAPRRDLKRDRSLALKALVNYKEKHEISERSKRKRDEEKSARQKEANSEPEIRNQEEKGVMLEEEDGGAPHEKEEDFDNPNDGAPVAPPPPAQPPPPPPPAKSPSRSFPTVDTPDIPPNEAGKAKLPVRNSEKEDSGSDSEGSDEKSEKPTEKKVVIQGTIFTPDDQRQFKPVSDIPADDLTVKRESSKKKKKKKRKSKKKKKAKSGKKPKHNKANHDDSSK
uniref:BLVR domain-containing protein n=1 Tax=Panagrellus redivivus TaxID=6233 RepID=A0A7E4VXE5_PANRE